MTINNIEDVMHRIMSLNRNLSESSLLTLLSASGWDKEDVQEGLAIFRRSAHEADVVSVSAPVYTPQSAAQIEIKNESPVQSQSATEELSKVPTSNSENFNLNTNDISFAKEESVASAINTNPFINTAPNISGDANINTGDVKYSALATSIDSSTNTRLATNSGSSSKSFAVLMSVGITLLLLLAGVYFYLSTIPKKSTSIKPSNISNSLNGSSSRNQNTSQTSSSAPSYSSSQKSTSTNLNTNTNTNAVSSSNDVAASGEVGFLQQQVSFAQKQIKDLENKINSLEKVKSVGQIKYVAGSRGSSGVGISKVDTNENGFVIHYTNGKVQTVAFSTTTILQIINAQALCLNATSSQTNANTNQASSTSCLDQKTLQNILSK